MSANYDVAGIMDYLRNQPDINPDEHDGSYELLRETVRAYTAITDDTFLDYHDLNVLYFMVIGTWKHGIERKKEVIKESHLPESEKTRLMSVIDRIWAQVCAGKYINQRDSNPPRLGMFGTGFMTFKGKAPDHCARDFVRMCAEIYPMTDEDAIFQRVEQVLTPNFRGMQAASVSVILHCMKPDIFPILNGNMGTDNIFVAVGLPLNKRAEASKYIANCRLIREFRNQSFTFRNYRVLDRAQRIMPKYAISDTSFPNAGHEFREASNPKNETGSIKQRNIADLKRLSYDDLRILFIQWCRNSGLAPSAYMTFVSDCFYLWRKEDPAQFWLAVESEDTVTYDILYQSLKNNSSGDAEKNAPAYARAIRRFRQFVASWLDGEENVPSNRTITPAPKNLIQPQVDLTASNGDAQPVYREWSSAPAKVTEISNRLEKKLDSLIGAFATIYSEKRSDAETDTPSPEETDKRFRIEATQGDGPVLIFRTKPAITGLIFTLKLCAVGPETSSERFRIFFANKNGELLSEPQEINIVAGKEYNCRFELKSSASEEKTVFLAVQGINAVPEEVRQLIQFPVKIAFVADFGL